MSSETVILVLGLGIAFLTGFGVAWIWRERR
jgi:hypothetical protein